MLLPTFKDYQYKYSFLDLDSCPCNHLQINIPPHSHQYKYSVLYLNKYYSDLHIWCDRLMRNMTLSTYLQWISTEYILSHPTLIIVFPVSTNMPNMAKYAKYAYLGAYLGAPNMVKWVVPETILQNAVQTRWS